MSTKKPLMTDTEIRHRKKIQAGISQAGGALGLTALSGTLVASRGGRNTLRKIPVVRHGVQVKGKQYYLKKPPKKDPNRDRIKGAVTPILATGAGLGGLGAFNFAAYTKAESQKRQRKQPVRKGHFEVAKKWEPVATQYSPETQRKRRNKREVGALAGGSAAAGGAGVYRALSGVGIKEMAKETKNKKKAEGLKLAAKGRYKSAGKYGAVSVAAGGGAVALNRRRKSESWS